MSGYPCAGNRTLRVSFFVFLGNASLYMQYAVTTCAWQPAQARGDILQGLIAYRQRVEKVRKHVGVAGQCPLAREAADASAPLASIPCSRHARAGPTGTPRQQLARTFPVSSIEDMCPPWQQTPMFHVAACLCNSIVQQTALIACITTSRPLRAVDSFAWTSVSRRYRPTDI